MAKRLKVLLSAYSCEPGKGSEPEVGWRWATSMARLCDVTVITRSNNRASIDSALAGSPQPHPEFLYYDLPPFLIRLKKAGMPVALYYLLWQAGIRRHLSHTLREFDIIHHVTFNSFRQPGFWWFCGGVPVVLGPLGGGQICPWRFFGLMRGRVAAELFRSLTVIVSPLLPHLLASFSSAKRILVANQDTGKRIPSVFRHKTIPMLETGVASDLLVNERCQRSKNEPVRVLWFSWLLPIKAPELALRAFAAARTTTPELRLTIAGGGPLEATLRALTRELRIEECVEWKGRVPRAHVSALLRAHDIFMFTSLRDTSGNVLLEAMAAGLPSVTLLHQGAAEIATDTTAIRVAPRFPEQVISDLAKAIQQLARSADLRQKLGDAAASRIREHYLWERKAESMFQVYSDCRDQPQGL